MLSAFRKAGASNLPKLYDALEIWCIIVWEAGPNRWAWIIWDNGSLQYHLFMHSGCLVHSVSLLWAARDPVGFLCLLQRSKSNAKVIHHPRFKERIYVCHQPRWTGSESPAHRSRLCRHYQQVAYRWVLPSSLSSKFGSHRVDYQKDGRFSYSHQYSGRGNGNDEEARDRINAFLRNMRQATSPQLQSGFMMPGQSQQELAYAQPMQAQQPTAVLSYTPVNMWLEFGSKLQQIVKRHTVGSISSNQYRSCRVSIECDAKLLMMGGKLFRKSHYPSAMSESSSGDGFFTPMGSDTDLLESMPI